MFCSKCIHSFGCLHRINQETVKDGETLENIFWLLFIWVFKIGFRRRGVCVCVCVCVLGRIADFRLAPGRDALEQALRVVFQVSTAFTSTGLPSLAVASAPSCGLWCGPCAGTAVLISSAHLPLTHTYWLRICIVLGFPKWLAWTLNLRSPSMSYPQLHIKIIWELRLSLILDQ